MGSTGNTESGPPAGPAGLGISTLIDHDVSFAELVPMIAEAGFTYISLGHVPQHSNYHEPRHRAGIAQLLAQYKLQLDHIHAPLVYTLDLSSPDEHLRLAMVEIVKNTIDACAELGGRAVAMHVSNGRPLSADEITRRLENGLASLEDLCGYAARSGVGLAIENLPVLSDDQKLTMELINATADWPHLGICLDSCHAWIGAGEDYDPAFLVKHLMPRVTCTHLSDTIDNADVHLVPGEGRADFGLIARRMGEAGYTGVIGLECSLSMLRHRMDCGECKPHDPLPPSTQNYLHRAYAAAHEILENVREAAEI